RDAAPGTSLSTDAAVMMNNSNNASDIVYARVFAPGLTHYNTITGNCFVDDNLNGVRDVNENGFSNLTLSSTGGYSYSAQPDLNGDFVCYADSGTIITTVQNLLYYTVT